MCRRRGARTGALKPLKPLKRRLRPKHTPRSSLAIILFTLLSALSVSHHTHRRRPAAASEPAAMVTSLVPPTPAPRHATAAAAHHSQQRARHAAAAARSTERLRKRSTTAALPSDKPPVAVAVRQAAPADVPRLAAIERACGADAAGWSERQLAEELGRDFARVLVAVDGGGGGGDGASPPLGHVAAWLVAGELQVLALAVDPAHRRRGVGRALLEALLAACGCDDGGGGVPAVLEVRDGNAAALALYGRCGFAVVGRRARFYADGADALLMARPPGGGKGGGG